MNIPKSKEFDEYINLQEALHRVMEKSALYSKLLKTFVKNTYIEQLRFELETNDLKNAQKTAHTIKGIAGNLSLTKLYNTIINLEEKLKEKSQYEQEMQEVEATLAKTLEFANMVLEESSSGDNT